MNDQLTPYTYFELSSCNNLELYPLFLCVEIVLRKSMGWLDKVVPPRELCITSVEWPVSTICYFAGWFVVSEDTVSLHKESRIVLFLACLGIVGRWVKQTYSVQSAPSLSVNWPNHYRTPIVLSHT